jgi:hypothetical protein
MWQKRMKKITNLGESLNGKKMKDLKGGVLAGGGCTWCWSGILQDAPGDPGTGTISRFCGFSSKLGASLHASAHPEYESTNLYQLC